MILRWVLRDKVKGMVFFFVEDWVLIEREREELFLFFVKMEEMEELDGFYRGKERGEGGKVWVFCLII